MAKPIKIIGRNPRSVLKKGERFQPQATAFPHPGVGVAPPQHPQAALQESAAPAPADGE